MFTFIMSLLVSRAINKSNLFPFKERFTATQMFNIYANSPVKNNAFLRNTF